MFGAGGGGFGTSTSGFGTATPFGSTTGQQQTPAFGGGGATTFGGGATSTFGAKPAFGTTATSGFGTTTTGFGAKPSVFGAPAAAPATAFGAAAPGTSAFGRTTSTSPFGATAGAFGATAPAPAGTFGAPAPAAAAGGLGTFGATPAPANPFGKPASSPFGAAPAPAAGGVFGAPAPATSGFGGFGTSSTAAAGGGLFGATPAPAPGAFGAPAPAPAGGLFGATPAAAGLSGGFGTGTSAFGAGSTQQKGTGNPPWRETRAEDPSGKPGANPGMLMSIAAMKEYEGKSHEELRVEDYLQNRKNSSAVSTASKGFGAAAAPSTGLFGGFGTTPAPAPAAGGFTFVGGGVSAAPAPAASTFGGGFGLATPAPAAGGFGTGFSAAAPAPSAGLFGAPAPAPATGFGFGTPAPAPGGLGGLFGTAAAPAPATGAFGAPAAAAPASTFGGFGTTAAPAATAPAVGFGTGVGAFRAPAPAPAAGAAFSFGSAAPAAAAPSTGFGTAGGLFGTAAAPAAPAPAGGFAFGTSSAAAPTPAAGTGAFSLTGSTGVFGAAPKPAATGLFGAVAPAPAASGFGFGAVAPAAASGGGFGGFGGAIGATAPAPAATSAFGGLSTGGIFGAPAAAATAAPAGGGLFGAVNQQQQQQQQQQQRVAVHNQDPYGSAGNAGFGSGALEQKIKGVENSSQQLAISFERNNAHSSGVGAPDQGGGVGQASPSLGFAYRRAPRSSAYIQPRGLGGGGVASAAASAKNGGSSSGNGGMPPPSSSRLLSEGALTPSGKSGVLSPDVYLSGGVKRLNIPPDTEERRQRYNKSRPLLIPSESAPPDNAGSGGGGGGTGNGDGGADQERRSIIGGGGRGGGGSSNDNGNGGGNMIGGGSAEETKGGEVTAPLGTPTAPGGSSSSNGHEAGIAASPSGSALRNTNGGGLASPPPSGSVGTDVRAAAGGADESVLDASSAGSAGRLFADGGHGDGAAAGRGGGGDDFAPRLDVEGYNTTPPMQELKAMGEDALRSVSGFAVSRPGFGKIEWVEPVDLRRVDIGRVVVIEHKSASVYDDLPEGEEKPPVGEGLNKPTEVTLRAVFPKGDDPSEDQKRRYEARVRKITEKMGAKLVQYNVEVGLWVFQTFHWSRYAMDDSDDEEGGASGGSGNGGKGGNGKGGKGGGDGRSPSAKLMPPPPPLGPSGRVPRARGPTPSRGHRQSGSAPRRSTKYSMPDTDDEGSIADSASDAGGPTETAVLRGGGADGDEEMNAPGPDGEDAVMADSGTFVNSDSVGSDPWIHPRHAATNLFPERDASQVEHMRSSLFVDEARGAAAGGLGGARGNGNAGVGAGDVREPPPQPSAWLPLPPPPPLPRRPALGNIADAEAAAKFRPIVAGSESRVLRLLADAGEPTVGEVADKGTRGGVRAGRMTADLGLRMGRGFRASWGPGGKLVCPGAIGGGAGESAGCHTVKVLRFDPTPAASGRDTEALYIAPLRNHLAFARPSREVGRGPGPPRWALPRRRHDDPSNYADLVRCMHGYAAAHSWARGADSGGGGRHERAAEDSPEWILEQAWRLAGAMWGQEEGEGRAQDLPMPGDIRGADVGRDIECDGASPSGRREAAVADWLAKAVASCVSANSKPVGGGGRGSPGGVAADGAGQEVLRRVLELLSVRRVEEAAEAAMAGGLPRLAVVLAAAGTQGVGRPTGRCAGKHLALQATLWQGAGADARMPQEAFAVYQLLGREGFRDVRLRGVIGKGAGSPHPSLDWLRQLGLCLWFGAGVPTGSGGAVAEAVAAYESLVTEEEALPPTARYFREATHHDKADLDQVCEELRRVHVGQGRALDGGGAASGRDRCVLSRLLAMYPSRSPGGGAGGSGAGSGASGVALLAALEPMAVTPDVMDYRHSWHLMSVAEALGVAEVTDPTKAAAVAEAMRFQLVSAGLWEWAVYVALTAAGDPVRREATARELVVRHGYGLLAASDSSRDAARLALLQQVEVPMAWVYEAAAVRAGYDHKSALPTPTAACALKKSTLTTTAGTGNIEDARETKLRLLVSAESADLWEDAASEACALAPGSMYLGGSALVRLAERFGYIARQLGRGEAASSSSRYGGGGGVRGGGLDGTLSSEFDAYSEILDAAKEQRSTLGRGGWSEEEVERFERVRRVVQPAAARVVGAAVAHEALNTVWKEAGISVVV